VAPIGWLRLVVGAAISSSLMSISMTARVRASTVRGCTEADNAERAPRSSSPGVLHASSARKEGGGATPDPSGDAAVSNSTSPTPTELTPSLRQWWLLDASAQRPSPSPSSRTISHSGRVRSRRWEKKSAVHSISSSSPPGAGSEARRT
jgi:hypothetical protein